MRQRINKIAVLFITMLFALISISITYAAWTDTINIYVDVETGGLKWEFWTAPYWQDEDAPNGNYLDPPYDQNVDPNFGFIDEFGNPVQPYDADENVAWGTAEALNPPNDHLIKVKLHNVYPGYFNHLFFNVHCYGSIPMKINDLLIYINLEDDPIAQITKQNVNNIFGVDLDGINGDDIQIIFEDNFGEQLHYSETQDISFYICILQPIPMESHFSFYMVYRAVQWNKYPNYTIDLSEDLKILVELEYNST